MFFFEFTAIISDQNVETFIQFLICFFYFLEYNNLSYVKHGLNLAVERAFFFLYFFIDRRKLNYKKPIV